MLFFLLLYLGKVWCCIDLLKDDEKNIECILKINKKSDITPLVISECSNLSARDNYIGNLCLCRINRIQNKFDLALSFCLKAKTQNPSSPYVHTEMVELYEYKNMHDNALTEAAFALSIAPDNFYVNMKYAQVVEHKSKKEALKFYDTALKIIKSSNTMFGNTKKDFIESRIAKLKKDIEIENLQAIEKKFKNCISEFEKMKDKNPQVAVGIMKGCLKLKSNISPQLRYDYIKTLYLSEDYSGVVGEVEYMSRDFLNRKKDEIDIILADSYFKTANYHKAAKYFKEIVEKKDKGLDIDILNKYAISLENIGDKLTALEIYKKMNSITKSPMIEDKIYELEMATLDNNAILEDLKIRGFVEKDKATLLPPEKKIFMIAKLLERKGAIEFLTKNYPGYANLVWRNPNNSNDVRLTAQGYSLYLRYISQRYIKEIEKTNIDLRDLFTVKDERGNDIFDKSGNLTYEGVICYFDFEKNKTKNWYLPNEVPVLRSSYEETDLNYLKTKKELEKQGYEEISQQEYLFLALKTNCPENVLLNHPCNIKRIKTKRDVKYFACASMQCVTDSYATAIKLFTYIIDYREGRTSIDDDTKTSRNFFGSQSIKRRFCENGKIWQGPEMISDEIINRDIEENLKKIAEYKRKAMKVVDEYGSKLKK